ncbi:MAG: DUF6268 family outer membrane beta-barrel protein [Myxococcota bacterium]
MRSLLILACSFPAVAYAQANNAIGITVELVQASPLEGDAGPEEPPELGYANIRANLLVPIRLEDWDAVLLPGASYRLYRPQFDDQITTENPRELHDINLQFGLLKRFGDTWSLLLSGGAGIATDFENVEGDHFRYQGIGLFRYGNGESWTFGLGVAFSYWFGEPQLFPSFQLLYHGDRWNADLTLPRIASVRYTVSDRFDVGFLGQLDGNRFSLGDDLPFESASLSIADAGMVVGVRIKGPIWFTAYGGVTLLRRLEFLDDQNNELLNLDQDPGPIFRLGVVIRPDRP